ncbi:diacylglycerol/lipid kinase family protein [Corynebacterium pseudopelargi]|uniref:Diacylglycerol kinase n=1 Tax=Corynebacterium pseudopelargi TaxID=2080757 RepID=A0A3G6IX67_9CORY|nr:diacylglycerol kinase family protein [Corynebacterium pseudopelargi]AZA08554.1 Diacylglycerol kinase [Corynebacterium pseudopelargi]
MRTLLIANPNSTTQSPRLFSRLIPTLREVEGLELKAVFTHYAGHAREICSGLSVEDYDVVIAVGGDGTVNEVVNGLLGPVDERRDPNEVPALAVIPTGSANVFVRALGFPAEPILATEELAKSLRTQRVRSVEVGTWDNEWFAVNAGFGIDADVIAGVDRVRSKGASATPFRYFKVAIQAWRRIHREPPQINISGTLKSGERFQEERLPLLIASNTNPWTFLGPLPVVTNPDNSFDQGLGLFGLRDISGVGGVAAMAHIVGFGHNKFMDRYLEPRTVSYDDVAEVEIHCEKEQRFQVDGEYVDQMSSVTLGALPDALRVYAPGKDSGDTPISRMRRLLSFIDPRS